MGGGVIKLSYPPCCLNCCLVISIHFLFASWIPLSTSRVNFCEPNYGSTQPGPTKKYIFKIDEIGIWIPIFFLEQFINMIEDKTIQNRTVIDKSMLKLTYIDIELSD